MDAVWNVIADVMMRKYVQLFIVAALIYGKKKFDLHDCESAIPLFNLD